MKIIARQNTIGKKEPVDSTITQLAKFPFFEGSEFKIERYDNELYNNHYKVELAYGSGEWYFYKPHIQLVDERHLLSMEQLRQIMPNATPGKLSKFLMPIIHAMAEFEINTKDRMAMFLAQIAHESGSLRWEEEIADGSQYEWRKDLGNLVAGDGRRYKG